MKKLMATLITFFLVLLFVLPSSAKEELKFNDNNLNKILRSFEEAKDYIGLTDVDFDKLEIGEAIRSYIYTTDGLNESHEYYPLFYNNRLVLFAIKKGQQYTVTDALVDEFSNITLDIDSCALLYDSNSCYLFNGKDIIRLVNHGKQIEGRLNIKENPLSRETLNKIELASSKKRKIINKNLLPQPKYGSSVYLNIPVVNQVYSNICWAGASASIINYLKGTSLTPFSIAVYKHGTTMWNTGLYADFIPSVFAHYGVYNYQCTSSGSVNVPSYQKILTNLGKNYPVYGDYTTGNDSHAAAVWGIDVYNTIYLMDSQYGANYSAQYGYLESNPSVYDEPVAYMYINAETNNTLWIVRAVIRYN